jgi:xylose isomerase
MFRRLAPYLVVFAGVGFFTCLSYFAYLARTSPSHPDLVTGHVAQMKTMAITFTCTPGRAGC